MLKFEFTHDLGLVRSVVTEPHRYHYMANDAAPRLSAFQVTDGEYVLATDDEKPVAVFVLRGNEVHFCFNECRWRRMVEIGKAFVEWIGRPLVGPVPSYNRIAFRLAKAVGFTHTRTIPGGTKSGEPFYLFVMEVA